MENESINSPLLPQLTHDMDLDDDGVIDPVTERGWYWFEDLEPGNYEVFETIQPGWEQTYPPAPGTHTVTLAAGETVEDLNFGNMEIPASIEPPAGMVSWWTGDGHANDIVDGNDGTLEGGTTFTGGMVGQAFNFDSDDDRVTIAHNQNLNVPPTGFTVDLWMRGAPSQPHSNFLVVDKSHGFVDSTGWVVQGTSATGKIVFGIGAGGPGTVNFPLVESLASVLDNELHHIAGTWGGSTVRLYVDGVSQGTDSLSTPANNNRPVNIAFSWGGGTPKRFFRGSVDEMEIFNRALSGEEIRAIYNAGSAGKIKPEPPEPPEPIPPPVGIVGWWPGDGNANDIVGRIHGTPQNGATFAPGVVGQAFRFDGNDDFVNLPDDAFDALFSEGEISIEAWMKTDAFGDTAAVMFEGAWWLYFDAAESGVITAVWDESWGTRLSSRVFIGDDKWHHVVATYSSGTANIYVDGALRASDRRILRNAARNRFGAGVFRNYPGLLDEITLYNRALTAKEVLAIYDAGSAGKVKP